MILRSGDGQCSVLLEIITAVPPCAVLSMWSSLIISCSYTLVALDSVDGI